MLILQQELPILVEPTKSSADRLAEKNEFISMGRSEVTCCPFGFMGVSEIMVKAPRDSFTSSDLLPLLYKIDNSASQTKVKHVSVQLVRILKFRSHGDLAQQMQDPIHRSVVFSGKYEGIEANQADQRFGKRIMIELGEVFNLGYLKKLRSSEER